MREVGVYDAKTRFTRLLDEVEQGEVITITRHGRPVARLVPIAEAPKNVAETIAAIRENRKGSRLDGLKLKELINEGRP